MRVTFAFAKLTVAELSRRRLPLALVGLTLAVIVGTGWGYSRLWTITQHGQPIGAVEVRLIASQLLILFTFMFAAVLALSAVLVAAPTLAAELESGLLLALLARPVRRSQVVAGKWLGLGLLVCLYAAGSGSLEMLVARLATGYSPPHPILLLLFLAAQGLVLLSLALLLSTRLASMTAGIVALVAYFAAWLGGIVGGAGQALDNEPLRQLGTISKLLLPTDALWRGAVWAMEPSAVIGLARLAGPGAAANPFLVADPIPAPLVAWAGAWLMAVLGLTLWSFGRREV